MSIIDKLTPHPVMKIPSLEEMKLLAEKIGPEKLKETLEMREEMIRLEREDPYRHGYEPAHWRDADELFNNKTEICILGGNRAGKTEWAAKKVIKTLMEKPGARVWCLHTTSQSSVQMQQNVVWKYMPKEFRGLKKNKVTNIQYSQKNGFSDNTFILPNTSQCFFMNYSQDRDVIEGGEVDLVWCDELVPLDWIETLRYRIVTRGGKLIVTFTPINGYSPVVKEYVAGCKIEKSLEADMLDPENQHVSGCKVGHMPYVASCYGKKDSSAMWFHSKLNPFNPYENLKKTLQGKTNYEIKIRAYGYAEALAGTQFPRFSDSHILSAEKVPEEGTNYMVVDPAGARNWFILWLRVSEDGTGYVYREWPDISLGEWALPGEKPDGKRGLAQNNGSGRGLNEYKEIIRELEGDEQIEVRYIDPRAGATQSVGKEGGTSLIELLAEDPDPMLFEPSAGVKQEQGISMINDLFSYDNNQPVSPINQPKLFVSEDCQNLIYCIKEWTGLDKENGASKDPIDCLRYLVVMNPIYTDEDSFKAVGGGSY
jgi:phage terminase large subunit-like protein